MPRAPGIWDPFWGPFEIWDTPLEFWDTPLEDLGPRNILGRPPGKNRAFAPTMVLDVLEPHDNILDDAFDRIGKFSFLVKWEPKN